MSDSKSNAKIAADRRLVEYFVIVSSIEQQSSAIKTNSNSGNNSSSTGSSPSKKQQQQQQQQGNGDISFSDWKTESSYCDEQDEDVFAQYQFKPTITARYPLHDHPDNPLHDNVIFFCHPSGSIQLRMEEYMPKVRRSAISKKAG
jgi:hypothetical protein